MSDIEDKVDRWDHEYLQEQVWQLEQELAQLRQEFEEFRNRMTSDGK